MVTIAIIVGAVMAQLLAIGLAMVAEEESAKAQKLKGSLLPVRSNGSGPAIGAFVAACVALWLAYMAGAL